MGLHSTHFYDKQQIIINKDMKPILYLIYNLFKPYKKQYESMVNLDI